MSVSSAIEVDISSLTFETLEKIRGYLKRMIDAKGSDLHIKANSVIRARINGNIVQFGGGIFAKADAITFAKELLKGRYAEFVEKKEIDLVYPFDENNRFRVNVFFQMDGVSAVFRTIPMQIPSMHDLYFPDVLETQVIFG